MEGFIGVSIASPGKESVISGGVDIVYKGMNVIRETKEVAQNTQAEEKGELRLTDAPE